MPASSKPPVTKPAPVHRQSFDPWNSSSTGHQRAENRLGASTGWRDSRDRKLMIQFASGPGGGKRVPDAVGEGSQDWDPQARALIPAAARQRAQCSVLDMLVKPGSMRLSSAAASASASAPVTPTMESTSPDDSQLARTSLSRDVIMAGERLAVEGSADDVRARARRRRRIFDGVVVYVNGSTYPLISDHRLRHVLVEHGGSMSGHLGRRKVTHVILGRPANGNGQGCGGGLAGGKLQREIAKVGGPGVKYVSVQWVLESIKAGKRLPESRFVDLKIAPRAQNSVYGLSSSLSTGGETQTLAPNVDEFQPPPSGQA
ncbi:BRCA1 C terminus domain-containing protein [Xylaria sp. CBS 124048]|nr:BRCA1 C terminus domain-containing protein [Xylaria sp. CBS 124048]